MSYYEKTVTSILNFKIKIRVLGLFSQNYGRRWYDKNLPLSRIFKSASSLQDDDFQNIMQGMFTSLKDENE